MRQRQSHSNAHCNLVPQPPIRYACPAANLINRITCDIAAKLSFHAPSHSHSSSAIRRRQHKHIHTQWRKYQRLACARPSLSACRLFMSKSKTCQVRHNSTFYKRFITNAPAAFPHHNTTSTIEKYRQKYLIEIIPTGGCGQAFTTLIVSPQFQGLNSLKRHRLVNAALKDEIAAIHAWTAKCQTPEEYEKNRANSAPSLEGTVEGHVEGTTA